MSLIELLNNGNDNQQTGEEIVSALGKEYNCYSNYATLSERLWEQLSPCGRKRLLVCLSLAAMDLSHRWVFSRYDYWDDRVKASMSFSFKNLTAFQRIFEKNAGFSLTVYPENGNSLLDCIYPVEIKDTYMKGFLLKWCTLHPTLKQSFFGGFVQGVLQKTSKNTFLPPLHYTEVVFPFI